MIDTVGADHVALGLDMVSARSGVTRNLERLRRGPTGDKQITTPANVAKVCGRNWFRVVDSAKASG